MVTIQSLITKRVWACLCVIGKLGDGAGLLLVDKRGVMITANRGTGNYHLWDGSTSTKVLG